MTRAPLQERAMKAYRLIVPLVGDSRGGIVTIANIQRAFAV
jgi:hypothetical protein